MATSALQGPQPASRAVPWIAGGLAVAFGLATLASGGRALFGGPEARAAAGNVVKFVLVFNFGAGFAYVLAGAGMVLGRSWALWLARALAVASLAVLAALGAHVLGGGAYEMRTVVAMVFRAAFWVVVAVVVGRVLRAR